MEFSPNHPIVKLCIQGMAMEDKGQPEGAAGIFLQAWHEATNDFEKYLTAFYVARHQSNEHDKLKWLLTSLHFALRMNDESVHGAFYTLYSGIARAYDQLDDHENAGKYFELADSYKNKISDPGPFYHGTKADIRIGDFLIAGKASNYKDEFIMNHVYFTALPNGAGLAASLAKGDGAERVYVVEPTGSFENDPNVTDKKFPGNPTRSYRTSEPLKVVGEVVDWTKLTSEEIQKWKDRLAKNTGEIIN